MTTNPNDGVGCAGESIAVEPAVTDLPGHFLVLGAEEPMNLVSGQLLGPFTVAYQTYGTLNAEKTNAILVCHALTGDQYVAEPHPVTGRPGWWERLVGPGKTVDTDSYFVICVNVLAGCMGSAGPKDIDPTTGQPFGLNFPLITITDMVAAQKLVVEHLGITQLFAVIGGSMGAMQTLEWAARYPEMVYCAIPIAGAARHSAQNIAFHEVGRQAIMADPKWDGGNYYAASDPPERGLAVARMAAHITYCRILPCTRSSGGTCRTARRSPSVSMRISRSRVTCAIRAAPSSSGSTRTRISISPGPWTISTSPPSMGTIWPAPLRALRCASA